SVKNMLGYGRYDQPEGTWSDDSSLILSTMDSLLSGYDLDAIGMGFCEWLFCGKWTPYGYSFDSGFTTFAALDDIFTKGVSAKESGQNTIDDNGNGSLSRIIPAALYFADEETEDYLDHIHAVSSITHSHPRALTGCGIYSLYVRELLCGEGDKYDALADAGEKAEEYYGKRDEYRGELEVFSRILNLTISSLPETEIYSSGYVLHTLEASIWSFLNTSNPHDTILKAVNLGLATDTTGTVAGSLAGLYYGLKDIPKEWIEKLAKKDEVDKLIGKFTDKVSEKLSS
ncbi:MAG: ADP-ribosylglycohydrolase family protein, partial [Chitinivibrionales bacterium]